MVKIYTKSELKRDKSKDEVIRIAKRRGVPTEDEDGKTLNKDDIIDAIIEDQEAEDGEEAEEEEEEEDEKPRKPFDWLR